MENNVILQARWLNSIDMRTHLIAQVLRESEDDIHQTLDEELDAVRAVEKHYRSEEWPNVLASIKEWQNEFPIEWRIAVRKDYVRERIEKVREAFYRECKEIAPDTTGLTVFAEKRAASFERQLNRLGMEAKILTGKAEGLTPEKIASARNHPISDFIQSRQGMTKCPFHLDKSPSLDVRKNFYYCYGCGAHGDVIDLVMKTKNLSFKEAVTLLS